MYYSFQLFLEVLRSVCLFLSSFRELFLQFSFFLVRNWGKSLFLISSASRRFSRLVIYSVWQNSKIKLKNKILLFRPHSREFFYHFFELWTPFSFPELRSFWSASGIDLRRWPKWWRLWEREWALNSCQKQLERCLEWRHSWIIANYWILAEYDLKNYGDRGLRRITPFKISTCNKYPTNNIFLRWC